jgi:enamine deaminase RidA (YjgF/YER057c/UK114 family)
MTERFADGGEEKAGYSRAVRRDVLGAVGPANTMLYVADLIGDGFLVEIEAQAVVPA